jgi:hypothetical protein
VLIGLVVLAVPTHAKRTACHARFEIAAPSGTPLSLRRVTRTATAGSCSFAFRVRLESRDGSAPCDGAQVTLRGAPAGGAVLAGQGSWQHLSLSPRGRHAAHRVLRARVAGAGSAKLLLRCAVRAQIAGCEAPLGESIACYVGGNDRLRIVGFDSGQACQGPAPADDAMGIFGTSLAIWNARAWTCVGNSLSGAFVSTPIDGGPDRQVAGPCRATATDGDSLLVLPHQGFDSGPTLGSARARRRLPGPIVVASVPSDPTKIRAYDAVEAIPAGPYRDVFDLGDVPPDSACAGFVIATMTAYDGIIYASGDRIDAAGNVMRDGRICVFDTRTGAVLPPLTLEGFTGQINGMSAIGQGRLVILSNESVSLPQPGYLPADPGASPGPTDSDKLHVFDTATGARLDSRTIDTSLATGLACFARSQ